MNAIGLFEAKTKFSEICARVAAKGVPVVIPRRGKLVKIEPIPRAKAKPVSVWDRRAELEQKQERFTEDFTLAPRAKPAWRNPLDD